MSPLQSDLEILTGKLVSGDLTALFYELIKDSEYSSDLIKEEEKPKKKKKQKKQDIEERTVSFESWLQKYL